MRFRPIDTWPGEETADYERKPSPFRSKWQNTLRKLVQELNKVGAENVVIHVDVAQAQIRPNGQLYASAKVHSPRVILTFESEFGPLIYSCDRYTGWGGVKSWQENLRAIAFGLEALRKIERYGIAKRGQQYAGWKRLPGSGESSTTMTARAASVAILEWSCLEFITVDNILEGEKAFTTAYRAAARHTHPDSQNGTHDKFVALTGCAKILRSHLGID